MVNTYKTLIWMPDARGYLRDVEIEEENTDLNRLAESGVHWRYLKEISY